MNNLFNSVQVSNTYYNKFDLSHSNKFTADLGLLIPTLSEEVLPGESWRFRLTQLIRTQPLVAPIMSNFYTQTHLFFVPNRLLYEDWSKFIVRGDDGQTDFVKPYYSVTDFSESTKKYFSPGSLLDYLDFPTIDPNNIPTSINLRVDLMLLNAYNLIYNEYYRDENLQFEVPILNKSGFEDNFNYLLECANELVETSEIKNLLDAYSLLNPFNLRHRAWRKDYFTSALPFVQKGPLVSLGRQQSGDSLLPVNFYGNPTNSTTDYYGMAFNNTGEQVPYSPLTNMNYYLPHLYTFNNSGAFPGSVLPTVLSAFVNLNDLQTNLMTIDDLRVGLALSQWYELNARVGSNRYTEFLFGHFGVKDKDARLQRPEYIGQFSSTINVSDVDQTSETGETPLGTPAGKGMGFSNSNSLTFYVPEHGFILAITSIMPHAVYQYGLPRKWTRFDPFDYYDKFFDHLSEQDIKRRELYFDYNDPTMNSDVGSYGDQNDSTFGYTPRFSEYRFAFNKVHGEFRDSLSYWNPTRKDIPRAPYLNDAFITVDGYTQSLYDSFAYTATSSEPSHHFLCYFDWNISAIRPMSRYATPKNF